MSKVNIFTFHENQKEAIYDSNCKCSIPDYPHYKFVHRKFVKQIGFWENKYILILYLKGL